MREFEAGERWKTKMNFVDENNVIVGFDTAACCCEDFGWYYSEGEEVAEIVAELSLDAEGLAPFRFDPEFFRTNDRVGKYDEEGGEVVFKLVHAETGAVIYLHLYNHHNGYYAHGFSLEVGGKTMQEGCI